VLCLSEIAEPCKGSLRSLGLSIQTFRRVHANTVAVEKQYELHGPALSICSLSYPACNTNEPYCCLWHVALQYFSTLSHKRHDIRGKKLLNIKCVFRFSPEILSATFLVLRITTRDMIKNEYCSPRKGPVILVIFQ